VHVRDDGKGFDASRLEPGLGISSIAGRVSQLNGTWLIDSRPGKGATLMVTLPVSAADSAPAPKT